MSAMVESFTKSNAPYAIPHRKPLPSGPPPPPPAVPPASTSTTMSTNTTDSLHSRTRTSSSSALPASYASIPTMTSAYPSQSQFIAGQPARRTLSNATTSTSSSGGGGPAIAPVRTPSALRRSGSGRTTSSIQPTSYVALMRKQKATVWSERAQHEDPRLLAAQRQAKMRATMEVVGGRSLPYRGNTPTGNQSQGLRSKIRHHGAQKTIAAGGNMAGAGVPMRLSANEVDGDSDEEFGNNYPSGYGGAYHRRTPSGRSSFGSERRDTSSQFLGAPSGGQQRYSTNSTPPSGQGSSPSEMERLDEETPVPGRVPANSNSYFHTQTGLSQGSGSSGSRENSFGQLGSMPERKEEPAGEEGKRPEGKRRSTQEDLMRRGSVDERTTTMTGVRLFVANPDLSD